MHFLISFLALALSQPWILRGRFQCCRSLMTLQGTPYCNRGVCVWGGQLEFSRMWLLNAGFNSLFLLKLGKNKEGKVLEQHEAH